MFEELNGIILSVNNIPPDNIEKFDVDNNLKTPWTPS